jgi:hypothetical protein
MEVNIRGEEVRALQTSFEVHRKSLIGFGEACAGGSIWRS